MAKPTTSIGHELYGSFRQSTELWIPGKWAQAVDSMLWLHHPTGASASPGLQFIEDPAGAAAYAKARGSQRPFVVQLSLGVARQLLVDERYEDAQAVMAFTKQHFPDIVLTNIPTEQKTAVNKSSKTEKDQREEERNLELLDGLVPT